MPEYEVTFKETRYLTFIVAATNETQAEKEATALYFDDPEEANIGNTVYGGIVQIKEAE